MKPTLKEITTSGNWIIDNYIQGYRGRVRVDAHTRHHVADGVNRYSEWHSLTYLNRLRREEGLCSAQKSKFWRY